MNKRIIYDNDDGGVCVFAPSIAGKKQVLRSGIKLNGPTPAIKVALHNILEGFNGKIPTDDEWFDFCALQIVPPGKSFEIVDTSTISSDRTFRNAWVKIDQRIEVDMPKARDIHMNHIRRVRNGVLDKSDIDVAKEIENSGSVGPVLKTWRQTLRDIPQTFDLKEFTDPQSLKNSWPPELPKEEIN